jgi:hypothetical protein
MAYGGAGMCTDFELRPKKCKIRAKIGKKLKKNIGLKSLTWTNFFFLVKNPKPLISMSSHKIGISDL